LTTPRIYLPREMEIGRTVELGGDHLRYVKSVLRLKEGNALILFSGRGTEYDAVIRGIAAETATVEITTRRDVRGAGIRTTIAQAIPKGPKMDLIVQKATELGASRIIPFHSSRSIPKLTTDKAHQKTARWQKIAIEAARQCRRADIPEVAEIQAFHDMLKMPEGGALRIVLWEDESERGIKDVLRDRVNEGIGDFFILIGPEGGFSKEELEEAATSGFIPVSLGPRVLRTETASLAVLAIIQYEKNQ
jgi:16S rRNA (uracil1498-N3)-methyltransferase